MQSAAELAAVLSSEGAGSGPGARVESELKKPVSQAPYAVAIFLGAFLLFQVQLLLGKQILPIFGGAPAVWTACLLVFQLLLLAGYAFAHRLAARTPLRIQATIQSSLLLLALAVFAVLSRAWPTPITPGISWRPGPETSPVWSIILFLLTAIGMPFFLLSTTSPLLQHWYAKAAPGESPYRLYALSNAGSLLGLLSYPFVVEPNFRLRTQAWMWIAGFVVFAAAYIACAIAIKRRFANSETSAQRSEPSSLPAKEHLPWTAPALWVALAACGSVLLLASTNFICQNIAVIPFLWVLPLSLYILSFIFCFESDRWYRREVFHPLFAVAAGLVVCLGLPSASTTPLQQIAASCVLLFTGCMICHGEAARSRPVAGLLTRFYLCISLGGALGGIFVSLIAPQIFSGYWEFPLAIVSCAGLMLWTASCDRSSWWHSGKLWLAAAVFGPLAVVLYRVAGNLWNGARQIPESVACGVGAALVCGAVLSYALQRRSAQARRTGLVRTSAGMGLAVLATGLAVPQDGAYYRTIARSRNFYGVLTVIDKQPENFITLCHGKTIHGSQFRSPELSRIPVGYYGPYGGANIVLTHWPYQPMRVGLVGMGTGSLAALARPGDVYRFYEINPGILRISNSAEALFTYTRDSQGHIETVLGDARQSLEKEAAHGELQKLDVLVLDAFSGDAVPMHLLTREAFELYLRHLNGPDSVIAVHVSNQALDLGPVLAGIAQEFQLHAIRTHPTWLPGVSGKSDWILLSQSAASLNSPQLKAASVPYPTGVQPILWTDDYSNLLRVLR